MDSPPPKCLKDCTDYAPFLMTVNENCSVNLNLKTNAIIKVYNKISKCKIHNNVTSSSIFFAFNLLATFTCSFQMFLLNANFFLVVSGEHWGKSIGNVQSSSQVNEAHHIYNISFHQPIKQTKKHLETNIPQIHIKTSKINLKQ